MWTAELHTDLIIEVARRRLAGARRVLAQDFAPDLRDHGVGLELLTVGGDFTLFADGHPGDQLSQTLALMDACLEEIAEAPQELHLVRVPADLTRADSLGCVMHWEGGGVIESTADLRIGWRLGLRSLGLTWNQANALADGCAAPGAGGLTPLGFDVVAEANRLGVLLDVSHLADRGTAEVCEASSEPVIASHSNARAVHDHVRNLRDEDLLRIAASGGLVGVCAYPPMLSSERATLEDVLRQLDYIVELIGVEHVGLGPDFTWFLHSSWFDSAGVRDFKRELSLPFPAGLASTDGFPLLAERLGQRGYAAADVEAIMGANAVRVLSTTLATSERQLAG